MTVTTLAPPEANSRSLLDEQTYALQTSVDVLPAPTVHPLQVTESNQPTALRRQPKQVTRKKYLNTASLTPAERMDLTDQLFEVYSETVHGFDRSEFESQVFGAGDVRLAVFYGANDELAGFTWAHIEHVAHDERTHAVFCASVYFRLGYCGGAAGALFGLREALRFKLRQPRTPLAYLTRSASPAVYRLLASTMPEVYPSRSAETPSHVEALVRTMVQRRGYVPVAEGPWVVGSVATPHEPARLRKLEDDPNVRFYLRTNPRFAEGDALLVWMPLNLANIVGGVARLLRGRLKR